MANLNMLDVAIGMVFLFSMVALSASTLRELIETRLKTRAIMIERGIREMLADKDGTLIMQGLFKHPQIASLFVGDYRHDALTRPFTRTPYYEPEAKGFFRRLWAKIRTRNQEKRAALEPAFQRAPTTEKRAAFNSNLPCYIPTRNFALALLDHTARGAFDPSDVRPATAEPLSIAAVRAGMSSLPNEAVKRIILNALDHSDGTLDGAIKALGEIYDSAMDRVTGWYKRQTQKILFAIGLALAILLNIDSLAITQRLSVDGAWRSAIVESAVKTTPAGDAVTTLAGKTETAEAERLRTSLNEHGFMTATNPFFAILHWNPASGAWAEFFRAIPGWLITALAAALGAPFWFDLLGKLSMVRSTLKPKPTEESASGTLGAGTTGNGPTGAASDRGTSAAALRQQGDFIPHRWKSGDPQEGIL